MKRPAVVVFSVALFAASANAALAADSRRWIPGLPAPAVSYKMHYVPPKNDPMHRLMAQAWRMFACIRWREDGDQPHERNSAGSAGMYQFQDATWRQYGGARFAPQANLATAAEQDVVAVRVFRAEQFYPWDGDPCVGAVRQYGKWGWW